MRQNSKCSIMLLSTSSLIFVFFVLNLVRWFIMEFGAYMSGFDGDVIWGMSYIKATSDHWSWNQVMWIYFAPYIALLFLFAITNWRRKYPSSIAPWLQLIQSWAFLLLALYVFFMPLIEVLTQQGIYYALSWLGIGRYLQVTFGILMFMFFIYKAFNVSALFSTLLKVSVNKLITPKKVLVQLPIIWYIPITLLTAVVYLSSNYTIPIDFIYFLSGMTLVMICNTWLISRYDVVVS